MELTVIIPGPPLLHARSPAPLPGEAGDRPDQPCRPGRPCQAARECGGCLLPAAIGPILDAFSPVISHERVLVAGPDGEVGGAVPETGQQAAFRLLLLAMGTSGCPFFRRALTPAPGRLAAGPDAGAFRRLVRAMSLPWREGGGGGWPVGLAELGLARCGRDIESHLEPVLREARRRCRQDAALNAVVLMYSSTRLAMEEVREALARPSAA
ncbi:hypothetical protein [Solidesulfovibrio sp.]